MKFGLIPIHTKQWDFLIKTCIAAYIHTSLYHTVLVIKRIFFFMNKKINKKVDP